MNKQSNFLLKTLRAIFLLILFPVAQSLYSDECVSGNCQNGLSTLFFSNGDKYTGNFKNGKQNGRGMMTFAARPDASGNFIYASKYSGEFKDGRFHGKGMMHFYNGSQYEGEFRDDKFNGTGIYIFPNGN